MKSTNNIMAIQRLSWCALGLLLLFGGAASSCNNGQPNMKGGPPGGRDGRGRGPRSAVTIQTTKVQRITIQREVDLAGSLASIDQAKVSSEVAGVIQKVLVELGQEVAAGQVVVRLDPRELDLALQRAKSQLRQTEAQLGIDGTRIKEPPPEEQISSVRMAIANRDDAQAQLRRAQRLRSQNLLPQADLDTAETKLKVAEANYQSAMENTQSLKATLQDRRQAVELAQKKLNDADIRSTIAGQISEKYVQQGEFIRENTAVVSIVQINPLKIKTAIQERYASLVRPGLPAEFSVESAPGQKFLGKVANVSPSVDQATRTFSVEILVDNSHRKLKPGFFVKGVISTYRDENVMAIPEKAISTLAGVSNVYIIEQGKARQQIVSQGVRIGDLVELLGGLKGDEVLAANNLSLLASGVPVNIAPAAKSNSSLESAPNPASEKESTGRKTGGRP